MAQRMGVKIGPNPPSKLRCINAASTVSLSEFSAVSLSLVELASTLMDC